MLFLSESGYRAQLGCDCELVPEDREISFTCLVGTSRRDKTLCPPWRRVKTSVRELGAQLGSSPSTSTVAVPPPAGTTQIWKFRYIVVNAIHLPSGDQSGSVGLGVPPVLITWGVPPEADILESVRRSRSLPA